LLFSALNLINLPVGKFSSDLAEFCIKAAKKVSKQTEGSYLVKKIE
jgi:hypothetical protein